MHCKDDKHDFQHRKLPQKKKGGGFGGGGERDNGSKIIFLKAERTWKPWAKLLQ